jgi:hypothetical protein
VISLTREHPATEADMNRRTFTLIQTLVLALLGATHASAGIVTTLTLTNPNSAVSPYPGPYGTVTINLVDSTHATIALSAANDGTHFYSFGADGALGFNVNATSWTMSNLAGSNSGSGFSGNNLSDGGAGNEDGFGSFNQTVNEFDGYGWSLTSISLKLANNSGTWASSDSVLAPNASQHLAAGHIFVSSTQNFSSAVATGFVTNGPPSAVPEPSTLIGGCLGCAMALGYGLRRRRAGRGTA